MYSAGSRTEAMFHLWMDVNDLVLQQMTMGISLWLYMWSIR